MRRKYSCIDRLTYNSYRKQFICELDNAIKTIFKSELAPNLEPESQKKDGEV